jgi:hypothetical protein
MTQQDNSPTIFDFRSYQNRDLIDVLEDALEKAKAGEITGMVFAFYLGGRQHGVGAVGHYKKNLRDTVAAAGQIIKYYSDDLNVIVKK